MKDTAAARRYAKAFLDMFKSAGTLDKISAELRQMADAINKNADLRKLMMHPAVSPSIKKNILDQLMEKLGISGETTSALRLVLAKGRIGIVESIAVEFEKMSYEEMGLAKALVTSAMELDEDDRNRLAEKLTKLTGKKAILTVKVDPSLIGGIIAQIDSAVYDGSVRNQLEALKAALN